MGERRTRVQRNRGPDTRRKGQVSERPRFLLATREQTVAAPVVVEPVEAQDPAAADEAEVSDVQVAMRTAQDVSGERNVAPLELDGELLLLRQDPFPVRESEVAPDPDGPSAHFIAAARRLPTLQERAGAELRHVEVRRGDILARDDLPPIGDELPGEAERGELLSPSPDDYGRDLAGEVFVREETAEVIVVPSLPPHSVRDRFQDLVRRTRSGQKLAFRLAGHRPPPSRTVAHPSSTRLA